MILRWFIAASVLWIVACKGEQESAPAEQEPASAEPAKPEPAAPAPPAPVQPEPAAPAEPAKPEPTTPEEIDTARKEAMLAGRDADVIKYCEMQGVTDGKGDPQVLLGCALAACRANQVDKARAWSKSLPKPLRKQAVEICHANQVAL